MYLKRVFLLIILALLVFTNATHADIIEDEVPIDSFIKNEIEANSINIDNIPSINSKSAIVIDRATKKILYSKNEYDVKKMASTTKIMTAIIVIENADLNESVTISKKASQTGGSTLGIKEGDKITVLDLLYGLLLKSGNDTAVALAEFVGGNIENFAEKMNQKANELKLESTHFVTPHGLDNDNHYTTAYELALITDYALNNDTFLNIVGTKNHIITVNGIPREISNTNELLGNLYGVYGVKTGFTNGANRCLVTSCKRDNLDVICVVLGADTKKLRTQDSIKLIEYVFDTYKVIDLEKIVNNYFDNWINDNINKFKINKCLGNNLKLCIKDFNYNLYPVKSKDLQNIHVQIFCNYSLEAPIKKYSKIGNIQINIGENDVLNFEILNTMRIDKKNLLNYFLEILSNFFKYLTFEF